MSNETARRSRDLSLLMTRWPSVTGSPDEAAFAERLRAHLAALRGGPHPFQPGCLGRR